LLEAGEAASGVAGRPENPIRRCFIRKLPRYDEENPISDIKEFFDDLFPDVSFFFPEGIFARVTNLFFFFFSLVA
jgi:hypothetical protein